MSRLAEGVFAGGRFSGRGLVCIRGERGVFADLDFDIASGQALVLSGANGSGKSSLLRLMAGLLTPAAGVLSWRDVPVAEDPEAHRARLHYVGHQDGVKAVLSVAENLGFWSRLKGASEAAVPDALGRMGLAAIAALPGRMLSAGQRRRLALARLLAAPLPLWLLDEPGVGLDRESLARLGAEIARHRAAGGLVIAATHGPLEIADAEVLKLGDFQVPADLEPAW